MVKVSSRFVTKAKMTKLLTISGGHSVELDNEDFEVFGLFRWTHSHGYAVRKSKGVTIYLHREIMKPGAGLVVDHINGNGLDCRRANMRLCNYKGNSANRRKSAGGTSGYKGVSWHKASGKWQAVIHVGESYQYLGTFDDPRDAALAYDKAAKSEWGEFANPNFP